MVPGVLLVALAAALLIEDLGLLALPGQAVPGLAALSLAAGFLVIWLFDYTAQRRSNYYSAPALSGRDPATFCSR
jgi:hypothetical protein